MTDTDELDEFRTAVALLHSFALESQVLNQRGIPRHLERIINITAQLSAEETQGRQAGNRGNDNE
jgi:hypothetical protein